MTTQPKPTNLDELLAAIYAGRYNEDGDLYDGNNTLTNLPTFGGVEPRDTTAIWSWDETRLLVGTHAGQPGEVGAFRIVARE